MVKDKDSSDKIINSKAVPFDKHYASPRNRSQIS